MSTAQPPVTKQPTEGGEEAPRDDAQKQQEPRKQTGGYQKQPYQQGQTQAQGGYQQRQQQPPRQQHANPAAQQAWAQQQSMQQAMHMQQQQAAGMVYGNYAYSSPYGVAAPAAYYQQAGYTAAAPQYAYNPYVQQQQQPMYAMYSVPVTAAAAPQRVVPVVTAPVAPAAVTVPVTVVPPAATPVAPATVELRAGVKEFVPGSFTPAAAAAAPAVAAPAPAPAATAAATTTATAPVPTRERKKFVIKSADGVQVDLEAIAKAPAPVKVEEAAPAKPAVSQPISIPSMPVTISQAAPAKTEDAKAEKPEVAAASVKPEPVVEDKKEVAVAAPEQATRRLVPQLNRGSASKPMKKYSKAEILALKPAVIPKLNFFPNIVEQRLDGPSRGGDRDRDRGDRDRDRDRDRGASEKSGDWKSGGGGGGGGKGRGSGGGGGGGSGGGEWKHEAPAKKKSAPPKKEITDPMQLLEGEVVDILNKITPDKFDRLSQQMLDMELRDSAMVNKIVDLVFEKAVKDHNFAGMYAQLCNVLKTKSLEKWVFHKIVKNLKDNHFFWIKDFDFPATVAGPFFSKSEICKWDTTAELPPMNPFTGSTEGAEYVLNNDVLMQIIPQKTTSGDQFYVSYVNFDTLPEEKRAKEMFASEAEAVKNAQSALSFRVALAHTCEKEFGISVSDDHLYDTVNKQLDDLIANRASITEEEYFAKEKEIMEQRFKLKARMIGTILFIGELYKQKMLNTGTMHDCITLLLGPPDKKEYDEQDLELLCKLMSTLGQDLESKSAKKPQWETSFKGYFERMEQLSKDRSIDSRIRFTIQDVIAVRANNWKLRREKEGPLKIAEIHEKAKLEEQKTLQQSKQADVRGGSSKNTPASASSSKGRTGDARNDKKPAPTPITIKSRSTPAATPVSPAVATINSKTLEFTDKTQQSKFLSCVKEFTTGQPIEEVRAMLETPVSSGFLVQAVLKHLLDLSVEAKRTKLLEIFRDEDILKEFSKHSAIVETAVEKSESVKTLVDSVMENMKAPEIVGGAVRLLVQKNIVVLSKIQDIVPKFIEENIALDLGDPDEINDVFNRFLAAVNP